MITEIADWIRRLAYLVLAVTFLELLAPENQMKRLVKVVIGFLITAALVMPVVNWFRIQRNLDVYPFFQDLSGVGAGTTWEIQEIGTRHTETLYSSAIGLEAVRCLKDQGISAQVSVDWSEKVGIHSVQAVLMDDHSPDQVKEVLANILQISPEQVRVKKF